MTDYKKTSSKL